ncbi:MAG TPA: polysaccharide biosynthesis/export family protein [Elusimicrobiota bacterium]|jgi:polysaccharide export outer membrane protein|nr:polysaccharide biosynthesis/export family protein [Elusimicrobiota bacterium]
MTSRLGVLLLSVALACGCRTAPRSPEKAGDAGASGAAAAAAAAQEAAAVAAAVRQAASARINYKLSPADLVSVSVYGVPEMDRKARIDAKGMIFLPFAGAVKVGGLSLGDARRLIQRKLSAYVVAPQVSLFIEDYGSKLFYVMGEVQKPGSYPIPAETRMTVLEAISTAGGFTPVAAQDRAHVLRYVNGVSMNYTVDVRDITREGQKDKDLVLQPNDVVYVPQSLF